MVHVDRTRFFHKNHQISYKLSRHGTY